MIGASPIAKDFGSETSTVPAVSDRVHDFALVIGVNDYPAFRSLKGAVDDANAFCQWLCDLDGGGLDAARVKLVTSTPTPTPKQEHIDEALQHIIEDADAIGGGRRLYVYFSGHGAAGTDAVDSVALLLADWSVKRAKLGLSSARYTQSLVDYGLFDEVAVFLDCCRTPGMSSVGQECSLTLRPKTRPTATRWLATYASERDRPAFEQFGDVSWSGVFTRCLLEIFTRADNGILAAALEDQLNIVLGGRHASQKAYVIGGLGPNARFGHRGRVSSLRVTFKATTTGIVTLYGGKGEVIGEHDPGAGTWIVPLTEGYLYRLVHPATKLREVIDFTGSIDREL